MKLKQKKPTGAFLIFCQAAAVALIAFCAYGTNEIHNLIEDPTNLRPFKVLDVSCRARGGSAVSIDFEGQEQTVAIRGELCRSLSEGDSVYLYYNKSSDFFYEPDNHEYERGIYGLSAFLLWSIIPWRKIIKQKL